MDLNAVLTQPYHVMGHHINSFSYVNHDSSCSKTVLLKFIFCLRVVAILYCGRVFVGKVRSLVLRFDVVRSDQFGCCRVRLCRLSLLWSVSCSQSFRNLKPIAGGCFGWSTVSTICCSASYISTCPWFL